MPPSLLRLRTAAALLTILPFAACKRESAPPPGVVARIEERNVTLSDFQRYLDRNAGTAITQIAPAAATALFDQYIDEILISEYSAKRGFQVKATEVSEALRNDQRASAVEKTDELRRAKLVASLYSKVPVPNDAEISRYYQLHRNEFRIGDQVRVRQILVHDEKESNAALAELKKAVSFEEVSKKYSRAPNADRGGDIGFVGRGQLPKVFEDVIFGLKVGEVSPPIKTETNFFHIFKVDEIRGAGDVSLSMARPEIEQKLREERLRTELDQALGEADEQLKVEAYPERLGFKYSGKFAANGE